MVFEARLYRIYVQKMARDTFFNNFFIISTASSDVTTTNRGNKSTITSLRMYSSKKYTILNYLSSNIFEKKKT